MSKLQRIESVLLFLVILFLPTQLGRHFWPGFSFVYSLPIDYLSPTLYFWDILVVSLCLIFILQGRQTNRLALNLFLLFLLTQTLSLLSSLANIGVGLVRLEQYAVAGLFGVYIASLKNIHKNAVIFWPLQVCILAVSVLAILQFIKGGTLGLWILGERSFSLSTPGIAKFDYMGAQFLRPYSTFPHPNVLAAFLVIAIILLWQWKTSYARFRMLCIILASLTTVLTVSRSAMLAAFLAGMFFLKKKGRIVLIALVIVLLPILHTRFSSLLNFDQFTILRREELFFVALNLSSKQPILGVGLNNFIPHAQDLLLVGPSRFLQPVHNIFLLSLSETGAIGLLGLISLLGYPVYRLLKQSPKPIPLNPMLLILGIVFFLGLFDHYFLTLPQGYRLLFLVWGLSLSHVKIIK